MEKKRDLTIDIIKGVAITAVVLLHINYSFPEWTLLKIRSAFGGVWHVAVFFIVGGWFFKDEKIANIRAFVIGKVKGLYLKSLLVYIPLVFFHNTFFSIKWLFPDIEYNHKFLDSYYSAGDVLVHSLKQIVFLNREPFAGAMWFVDSLFWGILLYGFITFFVLKICDKPRQAFYIKGVIFLLMTIISSIARDKYSIEIPKVSNTCSILVLLFVGQYLGQKKINFDNKIVLVASCLIFWQYDVLHRPMALNHNNYSDVVFLVVAPLSALYIIGFCGKKIQGDIVGRLFSYVGKESFWIMGLHMIGFHVFTTILETLGWNFEPHFTTPVLSNVFLVLGYLLFGVCVPLILVASLRFVLFKVRRFV